MSEHENDPGHARPMEPDPELAPLPGEPGIPDVARARAGAVSRKGLFALALLTVSLIAVTAISIQRWAAAGAKAEDSEARSAGERPAAAGNEARRLDLTPALPSSAPPPAPVLVPAIVPLPQERAQAIGVHPSAAPANRQRAAPEDAPVLLLSSNPAPAVAPGVRPARRTALEADIPSPGESAPAAEGLAETRRNLEAYQLQLQALLERLTRTPQADPAAPVSAPGSSPAHAPAGASPALAPPPPPGLFGGTMPRSATPRAQAALLAGRSLTLAKGTTFSCALTSRIVSAAAGFVGCLVQRNVYGDDGRVLLVERGSRLDGEYRVSSVKPGTVRIPVLWVRLRTPNGVTVDIDSPATGALGESGVDGYVDNRWPERIGAALLLSLIDDSVKLAIQNRSDGSGNDTVVLQSTLSETGKLAEKVLDSTINIPPLIYQNQGGIVGIYVARDVDFSAVYALQEASR